MGNSAIYTFFLIFLALAYIYIYTHYMCVCDIDMQHTVNVGCFLFAVLACFSNSGFLVLLMFNYKSASQEELRFFWG